MDPAALRESPAGSGSTSVEERGGNQTEEEEEEVADEGREADGESEEAEMESKDCDRSKCHDENSLNGKLTEEELDPRIQVN